MSVRTFYDTLAPWYHLIFADWDRSMERQSWALHAVMQRCLPSTPRRIWDAAAGIGTQAIGLARRGYSLTASDVSEPAIRRGRVEAARRHVRVPAVVADMRWLPMRTAAADLILACDNAVPHLLSSRAIRELLRSWYARLSPGGAFLISLRDYGPASPPGAEEVHEYGERVAAGKRVVLRQRWRWQPDRRYRVIFEFADGESGELLARPESEYYAIPPAEVVGLAREAGFADARIVDSDFYQPIVIGSRGS